MSEITPCPFCGSNRLSTPYRLPPVRRGQQRPHPEVREYFVQCVECRAEGPKWSTPDAAMTAWGASIKREAKDG